MDIAELSHPEKDVHVLPMGGRGKKNAASGINHCWAQRGDGQRLGRGKQCSAAGCGDSGPWVEALSCTVQLDTERGWGKPAALSAVSHPSWPLHCPQLAQESHRPPGQGLGIPRRCKKAMVLLIPARGKRS